MEEATDIARLQAYLICGEVGFSSRWNRMECTLSYQGFVKAGDLDIGALVLASLARCISQV